MSYSAVGSPFEAQTGSSLSSFTLAVSPTAIGDVLVLFVGSVGYHNVSHPANSTTDQPVSSVSGGGVTTWNRLVAKGVGSNYGADSEIWWGVISAIGSSTITVNWAGNSSYHILVAQQFHSTGSGTWSSGTETLVTTVAETGTSFTGLSAATTGQLYLAAQANAQINETISLSGGTAGEYPGGTAFGNVIFAYNLSPGTASQSPSWPSGTGGSYYTDGQVAGFLYIASSVNSNFFAFM
jgi:hypothetical protein